MIKDSEIVTKRYLTKELNSFRTEIKGQMKEQKIEIIREVRVMIHQTMEQAMENMKIYYQTETNRYIGAVIECLKDENRAIRDGIAMLIERTNNHEKRLDAAGL